MTPEENQTMKQQILNKLNPVRILTIMEWMEIAKIVWKVKYGNASQKMIHEHVYLLQQRFEELTRGKMEYKTAGDMASCNTEYGMVWQPAILRKEMFVCEVENPKPSDIKYYSEASQNGEISANRLFESDIKNYHQAQEKVWFEGFDYNKLTTFPIHYPMYLRKDNTVHDFIIECERAKADVKFTESFVNGLLSTTATPIKQK